MTFESLKLTTKTRNLFAFALCVSALICNQAYADSSSVRVDPNAGQTGQVSAGQQAPAKSFLSDFDALNISRYIIPHTNENSHIIDEMFLTYHFTERFSTTIWGTYYQWEAMNKYVNTDFDDTELKFNYAILLPKNGLPKVSLAALISIPTSHWSEDQGEYYGLGAGVYTDYSIGRWSFGAYSKYLHYFYENEFIPDTVTNSPATKSESNDVTTADMTPAIPVGPLPAAPVSLVPNASSYSESQVAIVYNPVAGLLLRNAVRIESWGYFDNHYINTIFDRYGPGYKFSKEFTAWASVENGSNTDSSGSLFDPQNSTFWLSIYWSI